MSVTQHIIAICGRRRSGKDLVADHLGKYHGFHNCKIADKLKRVCQILFGFTQEEVEVTKDEVSIKWGISPRAAMQFLGTEVMQFDIQKLLPGVKREFWVQSMIGDHLDKHARIVISDLRFLHEIDCLKRSRDESTRLTILRINRQLCRDSGVDAHVSECEVDTLPVDFEIENTGTIEDLLQKIDKLMERLGET